MNSATAGGVKTWPRQRGEYLEASVTLCVRGSMQRMVGPAAIGYNGSVKYTVIVRSGNESGYVATVPALPGCVTQGRTRRQALRNAREAIEAYIEAFIEDGLPVPIEATTEQVDVEVSAR
jgi:predicted RNase H-like HicB family nuclease